MIKNIPIGTKFYKLTVIGIGKIKKHYSYSICKCECGVIKEIRNDCLKSGNIKSCGCFIRNKLSKLFRKSIKIGTKFSFLTVIGIGSSLRYSGKNHSSSQCKCKCGNIVTISNNSLKRGTTKSCGCFNRQVARNNCKSHNITLIEILDTDTNPELTIKQALHLN